MQSPPFELIDIVVRAGAGAGKTTELTERVLRLAEEFHSQKQRFPHFVVTTFTRKATQELRERLMKEAMKRGNAALVDFVKRPSQLQISTIHGVLSLYLSRFGSVMGLSPKLTIISEQKETAQIKKKIRELCRKNEDFDRDFQTILENSEFSDVLSAFCQFFKLSLQFGELPFFGADDFRSEVRLRSQSLLESLKRYAAEIRSSEAPEAWLELASYCEAASIRIQAESDLADFWRRFAEDLPSPRKTKIIPDAVIEMRTQLKKEIESFFSWRMSSDFWKAHDDFCKIFGNCARALSEELLQSKLFAGEITMQDLETVSLLLIRRHPETAEAFSRQWDYWLVDEYQDTSPAQVEILRALSGSSKCFVVGDPQQSIYLFRGARSEVFEQKENEIKGKGVLSSKMINYRSRPELLEFFNFLFSNLGSQFRKMQPKSAVSRPEDVVAEILEVSANPESQEQDDEMQAVLYRCQELIRSGVSPERICVLSRNNRHLEDLAWLAQNNGIPVQLNSSGQFFERREIADALALLKFLCNPHDNKNLIQLLRSPAFKIPDQQLYDWCQNVETSHWQTFTRQKNDVIKKLQDWLQQARNSGIGQTWKEILVHAGYFQYAHFLDPSGKREANLWKMICMLRTQERNPGFSYLEMLKSLDLRSLSTEEPEEADAVPVIEPHKVHLMTVHASKGLQFAHVILPKMGKTPRSPATEFFLHCERTGKWTLSLLDPEDGARVGSLSALQLLETMKRRQKEEEDRVLYVALTRAQESVTLVWEEDPDKDSWANRLRIEKSEGTHTEESFSYRVRRGSFVPEKEEREEEKTRQPLHPFSPLLRIEMENFSVTEILEKKAIRSAAPKKTEMADVQKAMTGVDVHRILESLKYKWMKDPAFKWQSLLSELSPLHQQALEYVALDREGNWLDVIRSGEVEFGMTVKFKEKLIQGQIDLWGPGRGGEIWVVDYKTGNPSHQEKAFKQLEIYYWALRKINKIEPHQSVNLAVIYPFSKLTLVRSAPQFHEIERELRFVRE